jgi:hypothetical protein
LLQYREDELARPTEPDAKICTSCPSPKPGRDGLCAACRLAKYRAQRVSGPPITPSVLQELRLAYVGTTREVSANLNRLAARTGISKQRLKYAAGKHGWRTHAEHRRWTTEEIAYLEENLGSVSVSHIARRLRRSFRSVQCAAGKLERSLRLTDGYNVSDLCEVFGLNHTRIEGWMRRGLLGKAHGHGGHGGNIRFSEANVVRFIRQHPGEYDLSRVDQTWFKAMVFARLATYGERV